MANNRKMALFRAGLDGDLTFLVIPGANVAVARGVSNPASMTVKFRDTVNKTFVNTRSVEVGGLRYTPPVGGADPTPIQFSFSSNPEEVGGEAGVRYTVDTNKFINANHSVFLKYGVEYQVIIQSKELDIEDHVHASNFKVVNPLASVGAAVAGFNLDSNQVEAATIGQDIGIDVSLALQASASVDVVGSGAYEEALKPENLVSVEIDGVIETPTGDTYQGRSESVLYDSDVVGNDLYKVGAGYVYRLAFNTTSDQGVGAGNKVRVGGVIKTNLSMMWTQSDANSDAASGERYVYPAAGSLWEALRDTETAMKLSHTMISFGVPTPVVPRRQVTAAEVLAEVVVQEASGIATSRTSRLTKVKGKYCEDSEWALTGNAGIPGLRLVSYAGKTRADIVTQIKRDFPFDLNKNTDLIESANIEEGASTDKFQFKSYFHSAIAAGSNGPEHLQVYYNAAGDVIAHTEAGADLSSVAVIRTLMAPQNTPGADAGLTDTQLKALNFATTTYYSDDVALLATNDPQTYLSITGGDPNPNRRSFFYASLSVTSGSVTQLDDSNAQEQKDSYFIIGAPDWDQDGGATNNNKLASSSLFQGVTITSYNLQDMETEINKLENETQLTAQAPVNNRFTMLMDESGTVSSDIVSLANSKGLRISSGELDFLDLEFKPVTSKWETRDVPAVESVGADATSVASRDKPFQLIDTNSGYVNVDSPRSASELQAGQSLQLAGDTGKVVRANGNGVSSLVQYRTNFAPAYYAATFPKGALTQFVPYGATSAVTNEEITKTYLESGYKIYAVPSTMDCMFSGATRVTTGGEEKLMAIAIFTVGDKTTAYWPSSDPNSEIVDDDDNLSATAAIDKWTLLKTAAGYNSADGKLGIAAIPDTEVADDNTAENNDAHAAALALVPAELKVGAYSSITTDLPKGQRLFVFQMQIRENITYPAFLPRLKLNIIGIGANAETPTSIAVNSGLVTGGVAGGLSADVNSSKVKINSSGPVGADSIKTIYAASGYAADNGVKLRAEVVSNVGNDGIGIVLRNTTGTLSNDTSTEANGYLATSQINQFNETQFISVNKVAQEGETDKATYESPAFLTASFETNVAERQSLTNFAGTDIKNTVKAMFVTRNLLYKDGSPLSAPAAGAASKETYYYLNYSTEGLVNNYKRPDLDGEQMVKSVEGSSSATSDDNIIRVTTNLINKSPANGGSDGTTRFADGEKVFFWAWHSSLAGLDGEMSKDDLLDSNTIVSNLKTILDAAATVSNGANSDTKRYVELDFNANGNTQIADGTTLSLYAETGQDWTVSAIRYISGTRAANYYLPSHHSVTTASIGSRADITKDLTTLIDGVADNVTAEAVSAALKSASTENTRSAGQLPSVGASLNIDNQLSTITLTQPRNGRQLYSAFLIVDEETSFSQNANSNTPAAADFAPVLKITGLQNYVAASAGVAEVPVQLEGGLESFVESVTVTGNESTPASARLGDAVITITFKDAIQLGAGGVAAEKPSFNAAAMVVVDGNHEMAARFSSS